MKPTPALDHDAMMKAEFGTVVSASGKLERRIVFNLIEHCVAAGFTKLAVYDGEEMTAVADAKAAMELIFNLDEASMRFRKPGCSEHGVLLVLGEGADCIADWNYTEGDPDGFDAMMNAFDTDNYL